MQFDCRVMAPTASGHTIKEEVNGGILFWFFAHQLIATQAPAAGCKRVTESRQQHSATTVTGGRRDRRCTQLRQQVTPA